jgi:hypothetical protein
MEGREMPLGWTSKRDGKELKKGKGHRERRFLARDENLKGIISVEFSTSLTVVKQKFRQVRPYMTMSVCNSNI